MGRSWTDKVIHTFIKFTGDYSKLKSMGYSFQKLYAANYMQWCNGDTRVWKKGTDVTLDRLTNFEGPFFELFMHHYNNQIPIEFRHNVVSVICNNEDYTVSLDQTAYRQQWDDMVAGPLTQSLVSRDSLNPLLELIKLGWVELGIRG